MRDPLVAAAKSGAPGQRGAASISCAGLQSQSFLRRLTLLPEVMPWSAVLAAIAGVMPHRTPAAAVSAAAIVANLRRKPPRANAKEPVKCLI